MFILETGYEMKREDIIPHYLQQFVIRFHVKMEILATDTELLADQERLSVSLERYAVASCLGTYVFLPGRIMEEYRICAHA